MDKKTPAPPRVVEASVDGRLAPPGHMSPAEKGIWVSIVNSRPADWFQPEHEGMLTQYCRHRLNADSIFNQIQEMEQDWLKGDEGLDRYNKLSAMQERETRAMNALMRSMRLTQQSLYRADKAVKTQPGRKPWETK